MTQHRNLATGDVLPESLIDALQEFLGSGANNFAIDIVAGATSIQVVAGTGNAQASIAIVGKWRYNQATVTAAMPGTPNAGWNDIYVTASDNVFSGSPEVDSTNYSFGLAILATGTPATALYRKVGRVWWDGTRITGLEQQVGMQDGGGSMMPQATTPETTPLRARGAAAQTAPVVTVDDSTGATKISMMATGAVTLASTLTVTGGGLVVAGGSQVTAPSGVVAMFTGGTNLATESALANFQARARVGYDGTRVLLDDNGTNKSFGLSLNGADRLTVSPAGAVAVPGTLAVTGLINSTAGYQVAGTALAASHLSNGVSGTGAVALVNGPALAGVPTAPTAAPGTSSTQLATTAFVAAAVAGGTAANGGAAFLGNAQTFTAANTFTAPLTVRQPGASDTAIARGMLGVELIGSSMNTTNQYTPAVKFMSYDPDFTTENPKLLAGIVGRATQAYSADIASGMSIDFLTSQTNQGANNVPILAMSLAWNGLTVTGFVNAASYQVGGTALAASHLSNGTSGTGAVVLAAAPALTGVPTAPTAAVDTNTTQLATTAFVVGQGYLKSAAAATSYQPLDSDLTALAAMVTTGLYVNTGVGTAVARSIVGTTEVTVANGDGVAGNPTLAIGPAIARLASPTFTGVPAAPTATAGTNTTQVATTAFVTGALNTLAAGGAGNIAYVNAANAFTAAMTGTAATFSGNVTAAQMRMTTAAYVGAAGTTGLGLLSASGVQRFAADNTGLSFFGAATRAQAVGYGSGSMVGTRPAGGLTASSTPGDVLAVVSALVADLRTYGLIGA